MATATDTDAARILELHREFVTANQNIDVEWLRAHMAPGPDTLTWFNLNKSDYIGVDHICRLWEFLAHVAGGAEQFVQSIDPHVHVDGNIAWVDSHIDLEADFGAMGKVKQSSRARPRSGSATATTGRWSTSTAPSTRRTAGRAASE